jgi:hypothetical protein
VVARCVFVDVNVFKFSAVELPRYVPRRQRLQWGPKELDVVVHDAVVLNPNDAITNPELKREADLLPSVADLGKSGAVQFVLHHEALLELWGIPNQDSRTGLFFNAPLQFIQAPGQYERVAVGSGLDSQAEQYQFLLSLREPRFLEPQRATGAYQGANPVNRNQLLDAFHIWCAESHGAEYFLTLDFNLIASVQRSKAAVVCKLVRPSGLLAAFS